MKYFYISGGSTLEAMALAVEQSSVVLVCMTQAYKDSPNCRTGQYDKEFFHNAVFHS